MLSRTYFKCQFDCKTAQHMTACNYRRHLREQHNFTDDEMKKVQSSIVAMKAGGGPLYRCDNCSHICATKSGIRSHISRSHKSLVDPSQISLLGSQDDCNNVREGFSIDESHYGSLKIAEIRNDVTKKDDKCVKNSEGTLTCAETNCNWRGKTRKDYVCHMRAHVPEIEIENMDFFSTEEFEVWFNLRQRSSCSSLVIRNSYHNGKNKITHFKCHQEGSYRTQATVRMGHKSRKITGNVKCTCFAEVVEDTMQGKTSVVACFQHYSHSISVAAQILKADEKAEVARLIRLGMCNKQIANHFMKTVGKEARLAYLTFDDIRRIRKAEGLLPGRFDECDLESIKIRVKEQWSEGFRLFEEPIHSDGTGFRLVIITNGQKELMQRYSHRGVSLDDTFCVTRYSLKLTTILVLNGNDRALPVAFLLSNSTTSDDIAALFRCLRDVFPEFQPEFFISDEAMAFWNGYKMVFPDSTARKVLCRWHIQRSWRRKAVELLDSRLSSMISDKLSFLIREPTKNMLNHRLHDMLHLLDNDESDGARLFAHYFRTYYVDRIEEWSTAYRLGTPFQTTMFSENFHAILKRDILLKKTNLRIDEFVQCLFDGYEWILFKNAKQLARNLSKASPRLFETRKICKKSKNQLSEYLIEELSDSFLVRNVKSGKEYIVFDRESCSCEEENNVHCTECSACPYRFQCSCLFQKSGIGCKHVHMTLLTFGQNATIENVKPNIDVVGESSNIDVVGQSSNIDVVGQSSNIDVVTESSNIDVVSDSSDIDVIDVDVDSNDENERVHNDNFNYDERDMKISEINKTIENIVNTINIVRDDKNARIDIYLNKILADLQSIDLSNCYSTKILATRENYKRKAVPVRKTMNGYMKLKRRSKTKKSVSEFAEDNLKSLQEIEICVYCRLRDPPLPDDVDCEEEEALVTDWKVCEGCGIFIHLSCSLSCKLCEGCGGRFRYTGDISEEEISDSD